MENKDKMTATMEKTKTSRIERMTRLFVPYGKGEIAFAWPSQGPNTYQTVGQQLLARNLKVPTGDYSASLAHAAYCDPSIKNEPEIKEIRNIMKGNWLWVFNRNLWTPEGFYAVTDLQALGRSQPLDQNQLEKVLRNAKEVNGIRFSRNGRIRFAPKGSYNLEEQTPEQLAKDGFVVASYGLEGAEKLGEVASKFPYNPRIFGVDIKEGQNPKQRVSALVDDNGDGLDVIGYLWDDDYWGHAFGVLK